MYHSICRCKGCISSAGGSSSQASSSSNGAGKATPESVWQAEGGIPWNNTVKFEDVVTADKAKSPPVIYTAHNFVQRYLSAHPTVFKTPFASFSEPMSVAGVRKMNEKHARSVGTGGGGGTKLSSSKLTLYRQYKNSQASMGRMPFWIFQEAHSSLTRKISYSPIDNQFADLKGSI